MFLIVFRNRKRADIDAERYRADAMAMEASAREQAGFLSVKTYTADDGEVITLSEWRDEAAAQAWGRDHEHRQVQHRGRLEYYSDYTLFACSEPRISRFERESA
jgi:heme-degrading monooxygenase HmoA